MFSRRKGGGMPEPEAELPNFVEINSQGAKTKRDRDLQEIIAYNDGRESGHWRYHQQFDPSKSKVWCTITLVPSWMKGPEHLRTALYLACCPVESNYSWADMLYFCSCDQDKDGGKVVLAPFSTCMKNGENFKPSLHRNCDFCKCPVRYRRKVFFCSKCKETLCQICTEAIPTKPVDRFNYLQAEVKEEPNRWAHDMNNEELIPFNERRSDRRMHLGWDNFWH